ncbi:MAG: methyltransferase domain-containing protein [Acidobacteria bacterium]|nr:methyltransferase domain-containing protein [Acidobacteriota bacterium]
MTNTGKLTGWTRLEHGEVPIWIQPAVPDWFVPNRRADAILSAIASGAEAEDAAARYAAQWGVNPSLAIHQTLHLLERIPSRRPAPMEARHKRLSLNGLQELWLHLTNRCNLRCTHCMFASSPEASLELEPAELRRIVQEASGLGCELFYATGGEPMIHAGFPLLCELVAARRGTHLVTLTNALAAGRRRRLLEGLPRDRFHFQVSLDGPPSVHDALRGEGIFRRTQEGIRTLQELGFPLALAMVVDHRSVRHMEWLVEEAARLGVGSVHYLWYFVKGHGSAAELPETGELAAGLARARRTAGRLGVAIDNVEILRSQVLSLPGTRYDLTNAGWQSLAVGPDGQVYPTAALVLEPTLACGHFSEGLGKIWREAGPLDELRRASLVSVPELLARPLSFLTGGGDPDHSFVAGGTFVGADPWLELYEGTVLSLIAEQAGPENAVDRPAFRARMGERLEACSEEDALCAFTHSNCVLSLAEEDGHSLARSFYGEAARTPNEEIINPTSYEEATKAALPGSALSRSYGCGSPVLDAGIGAGDTVIDLGCGAGVELCIAAELVGREGRVIGIDMLDEMLDLAGQAARDMAGRLGYSNIELRKGLLEEVPLPDSSANVVISNCVINLTQDKRRTFQEIRRVLRPGGRLVVADVCCEEEPPLAVRYNEKLRGECIGGALRQDELLGLLEDVGFEGITILKRFPYREVSGHPFFSLTYAAAAPGGPVRRRGIYRGPFAAVVTEGGQLIPRGHTVELDLPAGTQDASVFLLDHNGAVTNVDLGAGCACFVPPRSEEAAAPQQRTSEGCMVCEAHLEYLETAEAMTCVYCGRTMSSSTRCVEGHFVCDECHVDGAPEAIVSIVAASGERDMIRLFEAVREHPSIPVHGPEYHALVPAVIVAAARNSGLSLGERHIRTAVERGRTVAGGACGFMGACGAALGVGAAFSVVLGANPFTGDKRSLLHSVTVSVLQEIGSLEAARCCQRDSWIALRAAARLSMEVLGVELLAPDGTVCGQMASNRNCLGSTCPFWPRRSTTPAAVTGRTSTLPVFTRPLSPDTDSA